jgi:hypothetical protein
MPIVIRPDVPLFAAPSEAAPVVLQAGSVIRAQVQQVLGDGMVRLAIGGQTIEAQSQIPLQAGQTLQLAVSQSADGTIELSLVTLPSGASAGQGAAPAAQAAATSDTITLAPLAAAAVAAQPAPAALSPTIQLTALETLALSAAAKSAATQQASLAQLFANLEVAAGLGGLPPQVQAAVAQVLALRTSLGPGLTGDAIDLAFQSSGLFLESSLASGSLASTSAAPDLKAALIILRQVLSTSLNPTPATQGEAVLSDAPLTSALPAVRAAPASPPEAPQAATSAAAPAPEQSAAAPAGAVPQPATATAPALLATIQAPPATPQAASPVVEILSPGAPTVAMDMAATLDSPSLAPLLASETEATVLLPGTLTGADNVPGLSLASPVILAQPSPADLAARAAAGFANLSLLQQAPPGGPLIATELMLENSQMLALLPAFAGARSQAVDDAEFAHSNVPPPPIGGALPAAQPVLPATLPSNASPSQVMHRLLTDTEGAIARQTLLQVASLPGPLDTPAARLDLAGPRWNFEIPFALPQGTAMAQFEISRDGTGHQDDPAKRVWRARFSLDVEPAGPVHALVSLSGDRTSVRLWAQRPATVAQLRAGAAQLSEALREAELTPGDIVIRDGAPPASVPARAGHFLDRAL